MMTCVSVPVLKPHCMFCGEELSRVKWQLSAGGHMKSQAPFFQCDECEALFVAEFNDKNCLVALMVKSCGEECNCK